MCVCGGGGGGGGGVKGKVGRGSIKYNKYMYPQSMF